MFHLQNLELVHWDYCQRVSLPLDASIITIAGPNGSGKTTLLDAMRTLLGLKCSQPRDYKTYARHAGAQTAWLRAVVDNRPRTRQTSSRPFAKWLHYADQVTLVCRIDRNGGDWQRRYLSIDGDVSIETLSATPDKELQLVGVEQWSRRLAAAGLSPAIAKVLSLEQGQTDRLCEYSPRELLRLVFDVFGDQEVLNDYEQAREHQQQLAREMAQSERELDHSKAQLAELQNKVVNYLSWQHKVQERERLATDVLPVLQWHAERLKLTERSRELRRQRQGAAAGNAERARNNARLLELLDAREHADSTERRLLRERDAANGALRTARDAEKPLEDLAAREQELRTLAAQEGDAQKVAELLRALESQRLQAQSQRAGVLNALSSAEQALESLQGQRTPPAPEEVRRFRQQLHNSQIAHRCLADAVEVRNEAWRAAIEGVLRPLRWMVLLDQAADEAVAFELAERERYRHYIVAPGEAAAAAEPHSLLAQISLDARVPRWLLQQLQALRCVTDPKEGVQSGGHWITPQAYMHDGRGARSVWVEPRDHQFGAAALLARRSAAARDQEQLSQELGRIDARLLALARQIADAQRAQQGHSAAAELARRGEEFAQAQAALPAARHARIAAGMRWQQLDADYSHAQKTTVQATTAHQQLEQRLHQATLEAQRQQNEWQQRRRQLSGDIDGSNARRRLFPRAWLLPERIGALLSTYKNDTQARLRLESVEQELAQDTWEKDATVEERFRRMEATVRDQSNNLDDHKVKNAQAGTAVHNARDSYIEVLRATVRRYRNNIKDLGELAGVVVTADLPHLENDDGVLSQAGLKVNFSFDGKGAIGLNDGEASGGQQVIKSLILLVGLLKDDETSGGFVFIDEPFAHLDVRNIQLVGHFLRSTQAQYVLTTPITHNLEVFEPAEITLVTSKKPAGARWAPAIAVAKRRGAPSAST